jgi:MFS family permease
MSTTPTYCINHPKTETLLRCIKCGNPVCLKCVVRTPVGYRCKQCTNTQFAGYYTATSLDHMLAAVIGLITSMIGGAIAMFIGNIWFFAVIFYAPAAAGIIAEIIRRVIQKRRGKYLWLVACGAFVLGALIIGGMLPVLLILGELFAPDELAGLGSIGIGAFLFNIGMWIYIVMGVGTIYVRLKN